MPFQVRPPTAHLATREGRGDPRVRAALLACTRAPGTKTAARRQIEQRGRHAGDLGQPGPTRIGTGTEPIRPFV